MGHDQIRADMQYQTFIKETPLTEKPPFCNKSINTFFDPSGEYLADFFKFSDFRDNYDYIFYELMRKISEKPASEKFSYRGVELLNCFKIYLFGYASYSAFMASTLQNFLDSNPEDSVYVSKQGTNWMTPYFNQVLPACSEEVSRRTRLVDDIASPKTNKERGILSALISPAIKDMLWPGKASFYYSRPRIAFFSDYERIKGFIPSSRRFAVFFTDSKSQKIFIRSLIKHISYHQIALAPKDTGHYDKIAAEIAGRVGDLKIFSGMKTNGYDIELVLNQKLSQMCRDKLPGLLYQIDQMHNFFKKNTSLRSALLDEDITMTKNAFCQIARQYGVTSYVECHGALIGAYGYVPVTADFIFAWGSEQKKTLMRWGCPSDKVIVSGCSRYNYYQKVKDLDVRKKLLWRFNFSESVKTVILVPSQMRSEWQFNGRIVFEQIQYILDHILKRSDIQLFIKLHPGDSGSDYYKNRCRRPDVRCSVKILRDVDPFWLIKASDFMIVQGSTMAIDGFALGRNVIYFSIIEAKTKVTNSAISDFEKYKVFYCPSDKEEFKNIFERLLKDSRSRPEGARWEDARRECLNETSVLSEDIITSYLSGTKKTGPDR